MQYIMIHSGLKLLSEDGTTDAKEASALGYRDSHIDVYSNSWGPSDFGFFVSGPGSLVQRTLVTGVAEVRATKYICTLEKLNVML